MTELENVLDPVSEEEHLKQIWRDLKVGENGFLTIAELSAVCEHIGMSHMDEEVCGRAIIIKEY